MSKAKENFEEIEIRSDGESDEDVESSEDEFLINDHSQEESFEINNDEMELNADLDSACDEDDDTPLSIRVAEMDEIWKKKRHVISIHHLLNTLARKISQKTLGNQEIFFYVYFQSKIFKGLSNNQIFIVSRKE